MKTLLHILAITALVITPALADKSVKAGPRHGRILELGGVNAEFFVEKDRTISIAFYDAAMKAQPVSAQVVTATAEAPGAKAKLDFEKKGDLLVSKTPLPAGEGYQVVVQAKTSPEAKPKNFRIKLELHTCGKCKNPEYACICDE
uniref:Uncharacterized protein n=1 Tax=uncultured Acidobacteria bacterium A11 TaxID=1036854 RepID=F8TTK3_9BACT|nr:hypothetical protein [uncultured Acidobacteria bacterium A11]